MLINILEKVRMQKGRGAAEDTYPWICVSVKWLENLLCNPFWFSECRNRMLRKLPRLLPWNRNWWMLYAWIWYQYVLLSSKDFFEKPDFHAFDDNARDEYLVSVNTVLMKNPRFCERLLCDQSIYYLFWYFISRLNPYCETEGSQARVIVAILLGIQNENWQKHCLMCMHYAWIAQEQGYIISSAFFISLCFHDFFLSLVQGALLNEEYVFQVFYTSFKSFSPKQFANSHLKLLTTPPEYLVSLSCEIAYCL